MDKKPHLKTPISYYGGKQQMLRHILPLIPEHHLYCEPFLGGAAVFFGKIPAPVEIINDLNEELINFYAMAKMRFRELNKLVKATLHSRKTHQRAWAIYCSPAGHDSITRAWATWVLSTQSFGSQLSSSWGYDRKKGSMAIKVTNKKRQFTEEICQRLEHTQIECKDAVSVIKAFDCEDAFFYADPPYPNTDQAHYSGYTTKDLQQLLEGLSMIKGKFLLSNYPQEIIQEFSDRYGWQNRRYKMPVAASKKSVKPSKIEVLTANYQIE